MKNKLVVTFTAAFTGILLGNITPKLELLPPAQAGFLDEAGRLIVGEVEHPGGVFEAPLEKRLTLVCKHAGGADLPYGAVGVYYYNVFLDNQKWIGRIDREFGSQTSINLRRGRHTYTIVDVDGHEVDRFIINAVPQN